MHDIFVNYRTGDEESVATLIDRELARRFGRERTFFASNSIELGHRFPDELVDAVEECEALIAVIGPRWAEVRGTDGRPALESEQDWTRREIRTALDRGALVIPVLVGRATRIDRTMLPEDLQGLADCQYSRFDHRDAEAGLMALGDSLARQLPALGTADRDAPAARKRAEPKARENRAPDAGPTRMRTRDVEQRVRGGIGNLNGDLSGTFVNEPQGPVNTGRGSQYNAPHFEGDNTGVQFTAGDNSGTVHQRFEGERRSSDEA
ncbi:MULTISPECIES: toll/interleukin-1 receptor domain-containing protein [unclassified Streptomyces]|uniref:toll/interleukin-1 receptor domain-containing protein n=1 Tax=unclassified Streptomyces TaxID=2593676 RepID=UPI00202ED21D|nr:MULTISPECIES: toll/interleukin-1 receptor domain-containing protein [unclassified Streptomyces]MCM1975124.1 toll/interleukin-1 receptor domain-containing protein [Streptomyces sp. G1]MCX5122745.1 toll/interleukin-1 receptor domain-containing protein [Streptomyces sp. NBC_00347]MCX5296102.1 toll/interleukin-1 receptor domain-containing protein [Streptomyces sp. NBC_00193]